MICLVGSATTFVIFVQIEERRPERRAAWIVTAGVAGALGIWSTHFIAMLACNDGDYVQYDPRITALSFVIVVLTTWSSIRLAFSRRGYAWFVSGGAVLALGVAAMHFTGLEAIRAQARLQFSPIGQVVAIVLGAAFGAAAFASFHHLRGPRRVAVATGLLVLSICSLHFTSMSAMTLVPDLRIARVAFGISHDQLAAAVVSVSFTLILIACAAVLLDKRLTDLQGLTNASLEGLLIVRDGRVIGANERFCSLTARALTDVIGKTPSSLLDLDSEAGLRTASGAPREIELHPLSGGAVAVEILCRNIEYRGRDSEVIVIHDLTERKEAQRRIVHLAHHDTLTDLANRTLFDERLGEALAHAQAREGEVAVLFMDLDRFKAVNDIFGHSAGDAILCKVAQILQGATQTGDTIGRLGGDEFAIVQVGQAQPEAARQLTNRILATFATEMDMERDPMAVGVSIGIALFPADGQAASPLCANADTALYRAKHSGRGGACFFDADMDLAVKHRRALEHDLRHAIVRQQLSVAYQPLMDVKTGAVKGYEALLRWRHPVHGPVGPDRFIPIAEESGSIIQLGEWVMEQACAEAALWPSPLSIAVNVSPIQFQLPNFFEFVAGVLARTGLDGRRLEIEITESVLMRDRDKVLALLHRLRSLGICIVMDDFGTGYSSLSNLQSFPFDKVKIDRSFTAALEHDPAARSIVRAIIGLGQSLGVPVLTEGVENEAQRLIVVEQGCAELQGYLFGKPGAEPSTFLTSSVKPSTAPRALTAADFLPAQWSA
ncbi:MAG: bifunctional diguanylate cyclase/phosphodiesterase [Caulobacteraceae bacterium]